MGSGTYVLPGTRDDQADHYNTNVFTTHFRMLCLKLLQMRWPYNILYFCFSNCSAADFCQESYYHLKRSINYFPCSIVSLAKLNDLLVKSNSLITTITIIIIVIIIFIIILLYFMRIISVS